MELDPLKEEIYIRIEYLWSLYWKSQNNNKLKKKGNKKEKKSINSLNDKDVNGISKENNNKKEGKRESSVLNRNFIEKTKNKKTKKLKN